MAEDKDTGKRVECPCRIISLSTWRASRTILSARTPTSSFLCMTSERASKSGRNCHLKGCVLYAFSGYIQLCSNGNAFMGNYSEGTVKNSTRGPIKKKVRRHFKSIKVWQMKACANTAYMYTEHFFFSSSTSLVQNGTQNFLCKGWDEDKRPWSMHVRISVLLTMLFRHRK